MSYVTLSDVKTYSGISLSTDDSLITSLIDRAQKAIETKTHRIFEASVDTTKYFSVDNTGWRTLYFDEDICAITTIKTNADNGSGGIIIPSTDYVTEPRNRTPYYAIKILSSSSYDWEYTDDPENGISITGKWAYSLTPPDDIKHACIRLVNYYYHQKDAAVFDTTAIPDAGVIQIPQGIPADVEILLSPYVKPVYA